MKIDVRTPTLEDLERFRACLAADPDHVGQDADSWISGPGDFMVFFNPKGDRVWIKIERVLRVNIQHDPACSKRAISRLLYKGFHWLLGASRNSQFSEVIFESRALPLIQFLQKLFGVKPVEENYSVRT